MPLCPAGLKLCEQSGFLEEIYFLCQLQAASPAERMSLSLRGHRSLPQSARGFYFIFEGIRTMREIQTDIHPLQNTGAHVRTHPPVHSTCSSPGPIDASAPNPTRDLRQELGGDPRAWTQHQL